MCLNKFLYQALSDDEKRKIYDAHGEEGLKKMGGENGHDPFDSFNRYCEKFILKHRIYPITTQYNISRIIIYQSSKFSFSCVLLVESVSHEIDKIRLSPLHQCTRETMHCSPVNNKKKSRVPSREHATFGQSKTVNVL